MLEGYQFLQSNTKKRFQDAHRVLDFQEFLQMVESQPASYLRNSAQYTLDAIKFFSFENKSDGLRELKSHKIFKQEWTEFPRTIFGQEEVQERLIKILTGFARNGQADKLVLLFGPNGSAKTSLLRALFEGIEAYSNTDEGTLFHFNWVFPSDLDLKSKLGITHQDSSLEKESSFAKLAQSKVGAVLRSELHENPLFLIPKEEREELFKIWLDNLKDPESIETFQRQKNHFLKGELSHKNAIIYEALLNEYSGDLQKVLRHVRVERLYLNNRFRRGLVSIDPQMGVDAQIRQVTLDQSMANLPPALQSLNLFQLEGDLIDGNRGLIQYNDLLKRPVEAFKYLLGTCESGHVNLGHIVAFLDTVFLASTNDRQLDAFRQHPEFYSFKSRLELIRVPYLRKYSDEAKIYRDTAVAASGKKELNPHTTRVLALWAVMTRLKKPLVENKEKELASLLENLTPLSKAKLYNGDPLRLPLKTDERRVLSAHVTKLYSEHQSQVYYEGLLGASARELKVLLQIAGQNPNYPTLSPIAVFDELEKLILRTQDFDYLRQESVDKGFHNFKEIIAFAREEWIEWVNEEVKSVLNLEPVEQIESLFNDYIVQVVPFARNEKVRNPHTGKFEAPREDIMKETEKHLQVEEAKRLEFRQNLVTRLGAWSLENQGHENELVYQDIFPDLWTKLQSAFAEKQRSKIVGMARYLLDLKDFSRLKETQNVEMNESQQLAQRAYLGLQSKFQYGPISARESLIELAKSRYQS